MRLDGGAGGLRKSVRSGEFGGFSFWTRSAPDCHNPLEAGHGCPGHRLFHRLVGWRPDVQSFLTSALLLALFVGVGIVAIVTIRSRFRGRGEDRGDWESALAGYKNLRDKGVLSPEEYRKIRTLVEPHIDAVSKQPDPPNPPVGQ